MLNKSAETRKREAYFKAGADTLGGYAMLFGLGLSAVTSLLCAIFDASLANALFAMAATWLSALGLGRLGVTFKADKIDELQVEIDPP